MTVIVVHGHSDPGCALPSRECLHRLDHAERLAYQYPAATVILSGHREATYMRGLWRPAANRVLCEPFSRSTRENVHQAHGLIRTLNPHARVTVVTSWWHAPRTWLLWRSTGLPVRVSCSRGSWRYARRELGALLRELRRCST